MEYLDFIIAIAISIVFVSSYFQKKYSNSMLFISIFILFYQFITVGYKWQNAPYVIICVYLLAKIYFKFQFKSRFINFVLFFLVGRSFSLILEQIDLSLILESVGKEVKIPFCLIINISSIIPPLLTETGFVLKAITFLDKLITCLLSPKDWPEGLQSKKIKASFPSNVFNLVTGISLNDKY